MATHVSDNMAGMIRRKGAFDYIGKPLYFDKLRLLISDAITSADNWSQTAILKDPTWVLRGDFTMSHQAATTGVVIDPVCGMEVVLGSADIIITTIDEKNTIFAPKAAAKPLNEIQKSF